MGVQAGVGAVNIVQLKEGSIFWLGRLPYLNNTFWVLYKYYSKNGSPEKHLHPFCNLTNPYHSKHTEVRTVVYTKCVEMVFVGPDLLTKIYVSPTYDSVNL